MRHRFDGKVVMITGASAGIGAETARQLAREGAQVALLARRADKLDAVCAEIEAMRGTAAPFVADVCDRASLDTAVSGIIKKYGHLDIVLANAGFGVPGSLQSLDIDDYRRQFETNFFGLLNTIYAVLSHLEESRGQLGILGSVAGMIGTPAASPYNASKFAVVGLAEAIYHDLDELGIAVTLINPGFVESEFRLLDDQGKLTGKQDPVPSWLVLPVDKAARSIINALYRRKPEVIITFHGKALVICKRFFPRFTRWIIHRMSKSRC